MSVDTHNSFTPGAYNDSQWITSSSQSATQSQTSSSSSSPSRSQSASPSQSTSGSQSRSQLGSPSMTATSSQSQSGSPSATVTSSLTQTPSDTQTASPTASPASVSPSAAPIQLGGILAIVFCILFVGTAMFAGYILCRRRRLSFILAHSESRATHEGSPLLSIPLVAPASGARLAIPTGERQHPSLANTLPGQHLESVPVQSLPDPSQIPRPDQDSEAGTRMSRRTALEAVFEEDPS